MVVGQAAADHGWASVLATRWAQEQSTRGKRLAVLSTPGRKNGRLCSAENGGDGNGTRLLVAGGSGRERELKAETEEADEQTEEAKERTGRLENTVKGIRGFGFIKAKFSMSQLTPFCLAHGVVGTC